MEGQTGKDFTSQAASAGLVLMLTAGWAGLASVAQAETIHVNCGGPGQRLGHALERAEPDDTRVISGTCAENIVIAKDGLTLVGAGGSIMGQVEVRGRRVTLSRLVVAGPAPAFPTGVFQQAGVVASDGASLLLAGVTISGQHAPGLLSSRNASVIAEGVVIANNGGDGVDAVDGGSARFDQPAGMIGNSITNNSGTGVFAGRSGTVSILGLPGQKTVITGNGSAAVFADFGASVRIVDATISSVAGQLAVDAQDMSVINLRDSTVSSLDQSAISAIDGSSAQVRGSTVTSAASTGAGGTIEVIRGSTLRIIGGNAVTNTAAGTALQAYSNAFVRVEDGTARGFPAALDTFASTGAAVLIGDLSSGLFKEGAITGDVNVEERGVLRMDKGADTLAITGGITLSQGAAAFFTGPVGSIGTGAPLLCFGATSNASNPDRLSSGNGNCPPI